MKLQVKLLRAVFLVLLFHLLIFFLYAAAWSPALQVKYGSISAGEFHMWLAIFTIPSAVGFAYYEHNTNKQILSKLIKWIFAAWFVALFYVLFLMPPEGKVMLVQ